jgi:hypothetical protein
MDTRSPREIKVQVYTRYAPRKVYARPHLIGETHIARGAHLELELYSTRSGDVQAVQTIKSIGSEEVAFDTRDVPFGCCAFRATFIDRHGTRFHTEVLQDKSPGDFDWFGSQEGVSRRVPRPWTPMKVSRRTGEMAVSCWGRDYVFGGGGFIKAVKSEGKDLLAGTVTPVARAEGKAVNWTGNRWKLISESRDQVVVQGDFSSATGLAISARIEIDFDGMTRIDWSISADRVIRLDGLAIELPVNTNLARYIYHFPGSWGGVRNVGSLPARDLRMGFRPFVWLGDENRGISWFAESNRDWFVKDPDRTTEVVHRGRSVALRINLITEPLKLIPGRRSGKSFTGHGESVEPLKPGGVVTDRLRYTFGVQATPVKPAGPDAWDQRIVCIGQSTTGFRPRLNVSNAFLDRLVKAGARAVVLFEHWTDAEGYTRTPHGAAVRKIVKACHDRGLRVLLYFSFLASEIADEWDAVGKECVIMPKGGYPVFHYQPQPDQAAWRVCLNSPWQDLLAHGMGKVMDDFGVDGVYLDGTEYPFGCCNTEHGCGLIHADGSIAQTYPIFGVRSAMRRIYEVVRSRKPDGLVNVHNSTCMTIPTLGWATSYWDGEQFQGIGKGVDVNQLLPLDAFRAEFMGRQWGVPSEFLLAGKAFTFQEAWAFTLLHDVPVRPTAEKEDLDLVAPIWRTMDDFGRGKAEWLPYWENAAYVKVTPGGYHASLYRHPKNGVLAVVSNLSGKDATASVGLNLRKLGLRGSTAEATDALTGASVKMADGRIRLKLPHLGWKLVWIRG